MNVPTALERTGDFSQTCQVTIGIVYYADGKHGTGPCSVANNPNPTVKAFTVYDPSSINMATGTRTAFPNPTGLGNVIPSASISKYAQAIFALMPLPDNPATGTVSSDSNNFVKKEVQRDLYGGYMIRLDQARKEETFTLDHNIVLNPRMILDLKYNVLNNYQNAFSGSANYNDSTLGLSSNYIGQMPLQGRPLFHGGGERRRE